MRRLATLAAVLGLAAVAWAADLVVVEDWRQPKLGARGIPAGWQGQSWGSPKYEFTVVDNDGHRVLHLRSQGEGSTISKDIKGKVDLKQTPILEWSWKVVVLPKGGDSRRKATDDQAAQVYVAWPRFPEAVRSRIIGYVWDTTAPVGLVAPSEKTGTVTYIIVRSGTADLGRWVTERRNVVEDFRRIYGEAPEAPGAVSIAIDSNDTTSSAESFMGSIVFRRQ
ncbi:MAG TPA: hypothetical protein DDZ42_19760 [Candidatus Rokubacteria bacterium]|nr:MAG: hypothetical protein A2050_14385 [Candidatus Rokubacteria bacterium GWA2_73_35]HBH04113.1 hypothetical protein [Candidatus Rokubacteria bacterium]